MTAKDRYKLALGILAKEGINGDLYGELAKAMTLFEQAKAVQSKLATAPPIPPPPTLQQPLTPQSEEPLGQPPPMPEETMTEPPENPMQNPY